MSEEFTGRVGDRRVYVDRFTTTGVVSGDPELVALVHTAFADAIFVQPAPPIGEYVQATFDTDIGVLAALLSVPDLIVVEAPEHVVAWCAAQPGEVRIEIEESVHV